MTLLIMYPDTFMLYMFDRPRSFHTLTCDRPHIYIYTSIVNMYNHHSTIDTAGSLLISKLLSRKMDQFEHLARTEIESLSHLLFFYTYDNNFELISFHAAHD